jgi:hypothetical protein
MNATTASGQEGIVTEYEHDKYGHPTGASFYRCTACGTEVMTSWGRGRLDHAAGCPNATEGER